MFKYGINFEKSLNVLYKLAAVSNESTDYNDYRLQIIDSSLHQKILIFGEDSI